MRGESRRRRQGRARGTGDIVDRVFVYGTLRQGQIARAMLADYIQSATAATMTGRLYVHRNGYPVVVEAEKSDDLVVGEVIELRDLAAAFPLLDAYEGHEYVRVLRKARTQDRGEEWVWVYVASDALAAVRGNQRIEDGDWLRYRARAG